MKLFLIFLTAFLIGLVALNQSLWLDEGTTARVVRQYSFLHIITQFSPHDFHPPLHYLVLKVWTNLFGYSEIALRFPSIIFSLATGWFIYLIGKKLKDEKTGIWSAIFFLFNPLIVYYSQEARMYMMTTFLLSVSLYYFLSISESSIPRFSLQWEPSAFGGIPSRSKRISSLSVIRQLNILLFNLFIFLSFLTFYGSIFLIFSFYLYLIFKKNFRALFYLLPGFTLALIIISPLLQRQWMNAQQSLHIVANWSMVLGKANLKNLFLIPLKFSIGRISFNPKILYWVVSGVWGIWVFWRVAKGGLKDKKLLFLFISPLVLGVIFSFFTPLLSYFRFLYLIPIMSILLVLGANKLWQRTFIAVGLSVLTFIYLLFPHFHREDWKNLAKNIPGNTAYMIKPSSDALAYYRSDLMIEDVRELETIDIKEKSIVIIPYTTEIYGYDYKIILTKLGYEKKSQKNFRGVFYEIWDKNRSSIRKFSKFSYTYSGLNS